MDNVELRNEYERVFDDDEKILNILKLESGSFSRKYDIVSLDEIGIPENIKTIRKDTKIGLTRLIHDLGVMSPIHLMTTESYDEGDEDDDFIPVKKYTLIEGLRRLYGAYKNGQKTIECIIWDFKDKEKGKQLILILNLILSKKQKRSNKETWEAMQLLDLQTESVITPGTVESLLDLEAGDSMRVKDIMLSDDEEVKEEFLGNKKSIDGCYKLLQKHRKEVDYLEKEDVTGVNVEAAEGIVSTEDSPLLSDEEVKKLLEMDEGSGLESIEELNMTNDVRGIEHQTSDDRHKIDKVIKDATLQRDGFKCQCCGEGGETWLGILVYHHKVPVSAGGPDTVDNGLTLCSNCHIRLHIYVEGDLIVPDLDKLEEDEKNRLRNIMKYGNIAIKAYKIRNMNKAQIKEVDMASRRHLMPGEGLKGNRQAFNEFKGKTAMA